MDSVDINKLIKLDLYKLLGVTLESTVDEIKSAYRKSALKCHPDKNPDDASAVERWHQLTKALEILTDEKTRAAYDSVLRGKIAAKERNRVLDSQRKRMKEDLEAREEAALRSTQTSRNEVEVLKQQIERLRKEGARIVEEEQAKVRKQMEEEAARLRSASDQPTAVDGFRLKVRWSAKLGGYTSDQLEELFSKYGTVNAVAVSSSKKGTAIVEFATREVACMVIEMEKGFPENPFTISWLSPPPPSNTASGKTEPKSAPHSFQSSYAKPAACSDRDFESVVLMRLRQAEERKRLIQQLEQEDAAASEQK